jgi:ribulose-phosphate 3-epimerase
MQVIPTILAKNKQSFLARWRLVKNFPAKRWQLDVMDGKFVPNQSWVTPEFLQDFKKIDWEVHLMITKPWLALDSWLAVSGLKKIIVHLEAVGPVQFKQMSKVCQTHKVVLALALNPETAPQVTAKYFAQRAAPQFLIMTVPPGRGGQKFLTEPLQKINWLKKRWPRAIIEVDGGIKRRQALLVRQAGGEILAVGQALKTKDDWRFFQQL